MTLDCTDTADEKCSGRGDAEDAVHRYLGYYVNSVKHSTYIAVDEHGVEAAAATVSEIVLGDFMRPPPDVSLVLDRPFSFLIRGNVTKSLLFMGNVYNPSTS